MEATKNSMYDEIDYRIMKNPFIVIIGISEYELPNESLKGVSNDINKMKELWQNKFNYKNVECITDKLGSNYVSVQQLNSFLNDISGTIQCNKEVDGLIIIYSGHGGYKNGENHIISSDNSSLSLTSIQEKFSSENLDFLSNRPKILYFDCCRGAQQLNADNIKIQSKGNKSSRYINKLSDFIVHFATCHNYQAFTKNEGGFLIDALSKCYTNNYKYHEMNAINLHTTSIKINEIINNDFKGQQTSEIIDRLTYDVYIMPYSEKENVNIQIISLPKLRIDLEKIKKEPMRTEEEIKRELMPILTVAFSLVLLTYYIYGSWYESGVYSWEILPSRGVCLSLFFLATIPSVIVTDILWGKINGICNGKKS